MRVLIVEDNVDTAEAFKMFIRESGHEVRVALTAEQAVRAVDWKPDVVFLDIGLPDMDGYLLATVLRAEGLTTAKLVVLSGYRPDEQRLNAFNIDAYLMKPVQLDMLLQHLEAPVASGDAR